jgi:hypothetical protein
MVLSGFMVKEWVLTGWRHRVAYVEHRHYASAKSPNTVGPRVVLSRALRLKGVMCRSNGLGH